MLNRVVLVGRLANDPELRYTPSGVAVASFRIAVQRKPNQQGEREADFIPIVAWRHSAEFAANYLTKGRLVAVDGKLQVRSWVAQDGTRRYATEVIADDLQSLERPKHQEETGESATGAESAGVEETMSTDEEPEDPFADE